MMGQELFENLHRQYELYRITPQERLTEVIGKPEGFSDDASEGGPDEKQAAAMEEVLAEDPGAVLTFDAATELWISGAEDDINRLFDDREEFVAALENGEDPGA